MFDEDDSVINIDQERQKHEAKPMIEQQNSWEKIKIYMNLLKMFEDNIHKLGKCNDQDSIHITWEYQKWLLYACNAVLVFL